MDEIKEYKSIDILFFERPLVDLKRYAFKIAKHINALDDNIKMAAVAIELPEKTDENCIHYFYHRDQISDIDVFLNKTGVKVIVFSNFRIPDMEFILHAKKLGIKTVLIQEGIIFEGANINDVTIKNIIALTGYIPKTLSYFSILYHMCKYDNCSYIKLLKFVLKRKKNITNSVSKAFSVSLLCDHVLTMGEYWEKYYTQTMGYDKDQIYLIGNHDLDGFEPGNSCEEAICYIATILVEDGTVHRKDFEKFIQAFANTVDLDTKIYLKLHPRSNTELYKAFANHNVEIVREGSLPPVNLYVGHSSTLMGRAIYESDNLILWNFSEKQENFYERFATYICTSQEELQQAIKSIDLSKKSNSKRDEISRIYWRNPKGALKSAAHFVAAYLKDK